MTTEPTLGAALDAWATTEPRGAGDEAALARILAHADAVSDCAPATVRSPSRAGARAPLWMVGGAVAASVAIAVFLGPRPDGARPDGPAAAGEAAAPVRLADADLADSAAFALLYTPTVEEEYQL